MGELRVDIASINRTITGSLRLPGRDELGKVTPIANQVDQPEEKSVTKKVTSVTLSQVALRVLETKSNYSREEVLARLREATGGDQERAEKGFTMMLEAGELEKVPRRERYYLKGSTPF